MSRFIGKHDLPPLLHAANHWKKACLLNNGSVFSERQLWTPKNLTLIEKLFVNNPDEGDNTFFEKLKEQLGTKLNKSQQRYMQFHRDYVYQMGRFYKNKVNEVEDIQSSVKC